jgi:hypothetical protein
MNKIYFNFKITLLLTLTFLALLATPALVRAGTINSLIASNDTSYLGTGFNSLTKKFIDDNICLTFRNIGTESADRVSNASYYCFVDSKQALEEQFLYNFSTAVGITPDSTAFSKVTAAIVQDTVFSTDKITMIAYWKQEEKKIFSADLPVISNEALAVLKDSSRTFLRTYGDKYVSAVTIGKILFIVYQADISSFGSYSDRTKKPIKQAMELNLKKIMGAKLTTAETDFATSQLADVKTKIYTYGNNVDPFIGPYTADDFKDVIKKVGKGSSGVIACELKDFTATANRRDENFCNVADYMALAKTWGTHLSNINFMMANPRLSFNLLSECRVMLKEINFQLDLINSLASEARLPNSREQNAFSTLYKRYIVEMQIVPRTYYLPTIENTTEINLSKISDVDTIKIVYFHPRRNLMWYLFLRKASVGLLMLDQYGNWSVLNSFPIGNNETITLYEGIKFCNQFELTFSKSQMYKTDIKVLVSFTEKIDDVIWLYLRSQIKR